MENTTRFGPYLLLKKLGEDAFGEVYRAGRFEAEGDGPKHISRLLHLRIFSIPGLDPRALLNALGDDTPKIQGPGLTYADETGDVGGVPFVAYNYEPRWSLRTLIREANTGFSDLTLDHAVLIAERIAKGLAVVHQEGKGTRGYHGLLSPDLIWVTGDGDIEITGLEYASVLVPLAQQGRLGDTVRPYLSPELSHGAAAAAIDDIYALGALLSEMLTGAPPPTDITLQLSTHLATATVAASGEAIPEGLAEVLQRSLLAAKGRTPDASKWYQQLVEWMGRAQLKATHFDLAFFIHELFRDPLQKEKDAVAKEKKRDYAVKEDTLPGVSAPPSPEPSPPPAAASSPLPVSAVSAPIPDATPASGYFSPPPEKKQNKVALIVIGAVIFLALAMSIFFVTRQPPVPQPAVVVPPPPPPPSTAEEEGDDMEESAVLQFATEELNRLVEERTKAMGNQLDKEYEEQIRQLQKQLEQARNLERQEVQRQREAPPPPAASARIAEKSAEDPSAPPPAASTSAAKPADSAATTPGTVPSGTAQSTPTQSAPTQSAPTQSDRPPAKVAATSPPPAKVAATPVVTTPKRIDIPTPVFPDRARRLRKEATVLISVLVGPDGKVIDAKPVSDEPVGFGFDQSALQAARRATFKPGTRDGVPTEMWTTVVISFRL